MQHTKGCGLQWHVSRYFHQKDEWVMRLYYIHNGNLYTGKTTSLYIKMAPRTQQPNGHWGTPWAKLYVNSLRHGTHGTTDVTGLTCEQWGSQLSYWHCRGFLALQLIIIVVLMPWRSHLSTIYWSTYWIFEILLICKFVTVEKRFCFCLHMFMICVFISIQKFCAEVHCPFIFLTCTLNPL